MSASGLRVDIQSVALAPRPATRGSAVQRTRSNSLRPASSDSRCTPKRSTLWKEKGHVSGKPSAAAEGSAELQALDVLETCFVESDIDNVGELPQKEFVRVVKAASQKVESRIIREQLQGIMLTLENANKAADLHDSTPISYYNFLEHLTEGLKVEAARQISASDQSLDNIEHSNKRPRSNETNGMEGNELFEHVVSQFRDKQGTVQKALRTLDPKGTGLILISDLRKLCDHLIFRMSDSQIKAIVARLGNKNNTLIRVPYNVLVSVDWKVTNITERERGWQAFARKLTNKLQEDMDGFIATFKCIDPKKNGSVKRFAFHQALEKWLGHFVSRNHFDRLTRHDVVRKRPESRSYSKKDKMISYDNMIRRFITYHGSEGWIDMSLEEDNRKYDALKEGNSSQNTQQMIAHDEPITDTNLDNSTGNEEEIRTEIDNNVGHYLETEKVTGLTEYSEQKPSEIERIDNERRQLGVELHTKEFDKLELPSRTGSMQSTISEDVAESQQIEDVHTRSDIAITPSSPTKVTVKNIEILGKKPGSSQSTNDSKMATSRAKPLLVKVQDPNPTIPVADVTSETNRRVLENFERVSHALQQQDPHDTGFVPRNNVLRILKKECGLHYSRVGASKLLHDMGISKEGDVSITAFLRFFRGNNIPRSIISNKKVLELSSESSHQTLSKSGGNVKLDSSVTSSIASNWIQMKAVFRQRDWQCTGTLAIKDFVACLSQFRIKLSKQQLATVEEVFGVQSRKSETVIKYLDFLRHYCKRSKQALRESLIHKKRMPPSSNSSSLVLKKSEAEKSTKLRQTKSNKAFSEKHSRDVSLASSLDDLKLTMRPSQDESLRNISKHVLAQWRDLRLACLKLDPKSGPGQPRTGYIPPDKFKDMLRKHNIPCSEEQFYHIFSRVGQDLSKGIKYDLFFQDIMASS
eukprot:m.24498 g.24498  ORF g.24498 m.24498 type:complete len:922 (-) comp7613_c0_seq1:47-2812(-)